jgi:hypothetical protein
MMNWKGFRRKRSWLNFMYYPGINIEELRNTTENLSQDSRFPCLDLNPVPPNCEAGVLTTRPRCSVFLCYTRLCKGSIFV